MERVGAENTDSIIITVLKPLQIRLYYALPPEKKNYSPHYISNQDLTHSGVIADHAVLTHIHAVNEAKEISHSSLWTLAQSHIVSRYFTSV
jgi:hypothetical protein